MIKPADRRQNFPGRLALAALMAFTMTSTASAQFAARFTASDYLGTDGGAAGSSGGTIYPFPNPYMPQTLAPQPEITGNYAVHYLYSPQTGQTYADPMFYHGLRALDRWDAIQASSRGVLTQPRMVRPTAPGTAVRRSLTEVEVEQEATRPTAMPSLQEVVDK